MKKIIIFLLFFNNIVAMVDNNNNITPEIPDIPPLEIVIAQNLEAAG